MTIVEDVDVEKTGTEPIPETEDKKESSDIVKVLTDAGHRTVEYPNGLVLGVRLVGVPGTRGVHVEVVHVLDLRRAVFGRSNLAVQAAILESVNRPLEGLLTDVELSGLLGVKALLSPLGKMEFQVLQSLNSELTSLVHETRTVYAVFQEGKSHRNLSWLTENSRIIPDNELALLLSSDSRSNLHEVQRRVDPDKWDDLEKGFQRAWFGILPIIMGVFAGLGIIGSIIGNGTLLIPLIVCAVSFPLGLWLIRGANSAMKGFQDAVQTEQHSLSQVGDSERVQSAISENIARLNLVGTLNFIVTPLMDNAAVAIEKGDTEASVTSLYSVLDECVRLAPISSDEEPTLSGDLGLEKFIGLFKNLGLEFQDGEEEGLGLSYVALTGHSSSPVKENEVMEHIAVMNNVLFDVGALSPEVKTRVDNLLNIRARDVIVEELNKELAEPEEIPKPEPEEEELDDFLQEYRETVQPEQEDVEEEEPEPVQGEVEEPDPEPPVIGAETVEGPEIESEIRVEPEPVETSEETPEEPVQVILDSEPEAESEVVPEEPEPKTGEEVVKRERKKRQRKGATDPLAHIRSSGRKKERGKTGA